MYSYSCTFESERENLISFKKRRFENCQKSIFRCSDGSCWQPASAMPRAKQRNEKNHLMNKKKGESK